MASWYKVSPELVHSVGLDAAYLYAILVSRYELSHMNSDRWQDDDGVFVRMSRKDMCEALCISKNTIVAIIDKLKSSGLINEKRPGMGHTNKIYLNIESPYFKVSTNVVNLSGSKSGTNQTNNWDSMGQNLVSKSSNSGTNNPNNWCQESQNMGHGTRYTLTRSTELDLLERKRAEKSYPQRAAAAMGYSQRTYPPGSLDHVYTDIMSEEFDDK